MNCYLKNSTADQGPYNEVDSGIMTHGKAVPSVASTSIAMSTETATQTQSNSNAATPSPSPSDLCPRDSNDLYVFSQDVSYEIKCDTVMGSEENFRRGSFEPDLLTCMRYCSQLNMDAADNATFCQAVQFSKTDNWCSMYGNKEGDAVSNDGFDTAFAR